VSGRAPLGEPLSGSPKAKILSERKRRAGRDSNADEPVNGRLTSPTGPDSDAKPMIPALIGRT